MIVIMSISVSMITFMITIIIGLLLASLLALLLVLSACQYLESTAADDSSTLLSSGYTEDKHIDPVIYTHSPDTVPLPSEQLVKVNVENYVSTLQAMDIAFVGKQIPYTYSEGKITNSHGYDWYVSKHFALKTDLDKDKAFLGG